MSTNPKADAWIESYFVRWGYDPGNTGNTEPLSQSLVSTNGFSARAAIAAEGVHDTVVGVLRAEEFRLSASNIAMQLLDNEQMAYENQVKPPDAPADWQPAREPVRTFIVATNGQVYRNGGKLDALLAVAAENNKLLRAVAGALKLDVSAILHPTTPTEES